MENELYDEQWDNHPGINEIQKKALITLAECRGNKEPIKYEEDWMSEKEEYECNTTTEEWKLICREQRIAQAWMCSCKLEMEHGSSIKDMELKFPAKAFSQMHKDLFLSNSAYTGNLDCVRYLLEHGANIKFTHADIWSMPDENGDYYQDYQHPFLEAISGGQLEVVKFMLENGAELRANYDEPLKEAALSGQIVVAEYLIDRGADIDVAIKNSDSKELCDYFKVLKKANELKKSLQERRVANPEVNRFKI